jgi:hypothetical protein
MGKAAIIIVLGFAVSLGILSRAITGRLSEAVSTSASYFEKTRAKNIGSSAAEIYLRKMKQGTVGIGSFWEPSLMGGQATVTITSIDKNSVAKPDTYKVVTIATYDLDNYSSAAIRDTIENIVEGNLSINSPQVSGAVSVSYGTKAGIKGGGGDTISGYNHDLAGKMDSNSCASAAGISYGNRYDTSYSASLSAKVNGKGPTVPDIEYNPLQPDYTAWANQLIAIRDTMITSDVTGAATWGTTADPRITYIYKSGGTVKINPGPIRGCGILIVEGDLNIKGSFQFTGLVIALGDPNNTSAECKINTDPGSFINGALIEAGSTAAKVNIGGSMNITYSCVAIGVALSTAQVPGNYIVDDWWE